MSCGSQAPSSSSNLFLWVQLGESTGRLEIPLPPTTSTAPPPSSTRLRRRLLLLYFYYFICDSVFFLNLVKVTPIFYGDPPGASRFSKVFLLNGWSRGLSRNW